MQEVEDIPKGKEERTKKKLKVSFSWFLTSLKLQIVQIFNVRDGADLDGTVLNIKKDLEFKGHNIWILVFSIFIASIGLNLNSTAVIIGAMLISPLMGPIQGIGLSLGTNDFATLLVSFRNLLVMIFVSLLTSFIFFKLSPFQEAQSEILGRTKPNLFDAFVAIFGGLAGIIAGSRFERGNVIPGVAIATALMPPLCTAGYGLATGQYTYFFGAFYLFLLNSAFICMTTILVVKYLRVPLVHYVNPRKERQIKLFVGVLAVLVILPSFVTLFDVTKEYKHQNEVKSFLKKEVKFAQSVMVKSESKYNLDSLSSIRLVYNALIPSESTVNSSLMLTFIGEPLDSNQALSLEQKLNKYVSNTKLTIVQPKDNSIEYAKTINSLESNSNELKVAYSQANNQLEVQKSNLVELETKLEQMAQDTLPMAVIRTDVVSLYPMVSDISGGFLKNSKGESIPTFIVYWMKNYRSVSEKRKMMQNIENWLEKKTKTENVTVISL